MRYIAFLILILCFAAPAQAKTASVTYQYAGDTSDTVGIVASETPGFSQTLQGGATVTGAIDTDKDGTVEINNLVSGVTYYFSAVAWDINHD